MARVRFADGVFRGVDDPTFSVPLVDNIRLGWASEGDPFAWVENSSIDIWLSADTSPAFVTFEILNVPSPLPAQAYFASYEVRT